MHAAQGAGIALGDALACMADQDRWGSNGTERDRHQGCARAQSEKRRRDHPARQARGHHGTVGIGQVESRVRHHVRRGSAPLRREPLELRAHVPRPDEQTRPRQHRRPVAGGVDRPEDHVEEPALHRGHHHRDLRLPASAVRARGRAALPRMRPRDQEADHRPGDRRDSASRRGRPHQGDHHGARGDGPQGRVHQAVRRPAERGFQPRAH